MSEKRETALRSMHEPTVKGAVAEAIELAKRIRRMPKSLDGDGHDCRPRRRVAHSRKGLGENTKSLTEKTHRENSGVTGLCG